MPASRSFAFEMNRSCVVMVFLSLRVAAEPIGCADVRRRSGAGGMGWHEAEGGSLVRQRGVTLSSAALTVRSVDVVELRARHTMILEFAVSREQFISIV